MSALAHIDAKVPQVCKNPVSLEVQNLVSTVMRLTGIKKANVK